MREGITVGLVGAAVAMLLFLGVDLAAGAPLRTPAMLGNALFHGARGASEVAIATPVVLGYTAVHLAGFVLFGLAMSGLFALAEREKRVLALIFMLGCCLAVIFVAMVYGLSQWVRDAMTPWVFLAGHVLAGVAVVGGSGTSTAGSCASSPPRPNSRAGGGGRRGPRRGNRYPVDPTRCRIRRSTPT